jgi:hypothetical protein
LIFAEKEIKKVCAVARLICITILHLYLSRHPSLSSFLRQKVRNQQGNKTKKKSKNRSEEPATERWRWRAWRGGVRRTRSSCGGLGAGGEGVRRVRGGERRGGARRRARRVRGRNQGGADRAQDHLHREEGGPRRHVPQRRLHPVQGTAARLDSEFRSCVRDRRSGWVGVGAGCVRHGACRSVRPRAPTQVVVFALADFAELCLEAT